MAGVADFTFKPRAIRVQQIFLLTLAIVMISFFIYFCPQQIFALRQKFPQNISLRWFISFPSERKIQSKLLAMKYYAFLNRFIFLAFTGNQTLSQDELGQGIVYYGAMQGQLPQVVSVGLFKGFYEYYYGRKQEAENLFITVATKMPSLFWAEYDLGIMYLEAGRPDLADHFFEAAINIPFDLIQKAMLASPLYRQLIDFRMVTEQLLIYRLEQARQRCVMVRELLHRSSENIDAKELRKLGLFVTVL